MADVLRLTLEEEALLAGAEGPGVQKAMEIVAALGRIYGASDLVPVASVQVAGVSYKNLGQAGVEFLREWAEQGARVRVPTMLNPMGMERDRWQEMGIATGFAEPQLEAIRAFTRMGAMPTLSCTPYLLAYAPRRGEHLAWAESSAVIFANSVIGARSNREGGPSALAAAIVGKTARYGLHLDGERRGTHRIEVRCPVEDVPDFGALGYLVGKAVDAGIPYFADLREQLPPLPEDVTLGGEAGDRLKTMGAAMAAYGNIALYHIAGYTPEASDAGGDLMPPNDAPRIVIESLEEAYAFMDRNQDVRQIDMVTIGCPHASYNELRQIAEYLAGKQVKAQLWVTTARLTRERAAADGWVQQIEAAGGHVVADTCTIVAPIQTLGIRTMATNAAKTACYAPSHSQVAVRYGSLERCLEAAITGEWQ